MNFLSKKPKYHNALFEQIRTKPWNSHYFKLPDWFANYPTMLTREEMLMLTWLAANRNDGDIVDLGAFLGGSSICFAHGLKTSGSVHKVHSYDVFRMSEKLKENYLYKRGHDHFEGEDSLPAVKKLTAKLADFIVLHQGDIMLEKSPVEQIGLLFVDLAKTADIHDYLVHEFYSKLKPGSIIIQQDFLFYNTPWVIYGMHALGSAIEYLSHTADHSVIFGVKEELTPDKLKSCLYKDVPHAKIRHAITAMKELFSETRQREMMDASLQSFNRNPRVAKSWNFVNAADIPVVFKF